MANRDYLQWSASMGFIAKPEPVVLLLLGQGAVFAPARRASRVSPVEATRSV
jgi:hypothetical protein